MEFLTILLSSLLAAVSPAGLVIDTVVENAFRSRLNKVEQLQVRVDNAPSYQIVQGKVERVRVAGRGLWLTPDIRIGVLELETDPINLDLQRLRGGEGSPREAIRQPVQAGMRLVMGEEDMNKALQSPAVIARLQGVANRLLGGSSDRYELRNPQVDFLGDDRLRFQLELQEKDAEPLAIALESKLSITAGHTLQLIEPAVAVNGRVLSPRLVAGFTAGFSNRLDLRKLEDAGITARLLQLDVNPGDLEVAAFVRVDASNRASALGTGINKQRTVTSYQRPNVALLVSGNSLFPTSTGGKF